jgi:uncharacterized protein (TIGR03437 family)
MTSSKIAPASPPSTQPVAGAQLFFGRKNAPISYAGPGQINAIVPWGVTPDLLSQQVRVQNGDQLSDPVAVDLASAQPAVYQSPGSTYAYAVDFPADGSAQFEMSLTIRRRPMTYCKSTLWGWEPPIRRSPTAGSVRAGSVRRLPPTCLAASR